MAKISLSAFSDEAGSSIKEQINALKFNGIGYSELRSIDKINVLDFSEKQSKDFFNEFSDNGIKVWALGSPLGKDDINIEKDALLDKCKKLCETAKIFNTDKIRMFSFFSAYDKRDKVIDNLNLLVEEASKYGVKLYHENEKEVYGDTADRVLDLMQSVKGLNFVYDPANFLQVGENADKTLEMFHSKCGYFHIKDVIVETDQLVPAGHGDGKIDKLISMIDRDVTITAEPHLAVFDAFKTIDNTEMKHKFHFEDNLSAFNFAIQSIKKILTDNGYINKNNIYIKGE